MNLLTLAEAETSELDKIVAFIRSTPFLLAPEVDKQVSAVELGLFFTLKDENLQIIGTTSVIGTGLPGYLEMANSGVAGHWQKGFGFQRLFYQVRAAAVAATFKYPPRLLTAIKPDNARSLKNSLEVGFTPTYVSWDCGGCDELDNAVSAGRVCCHDVFELPTLSHRKLCDDFLKLTINGASFDRSNGQSTIRIQLMVNCLVALGEEKRRAIREFADG